MPTAVVVSDRPWTQGLSRRLADRTGWAVSDLTAPEEFTRGELERLGAELILVPFWSRIIPESIFGSFECVIFHTSHLPYGRGGSPIQNLIVRGHRSTSVTALGCVAELDAGPIYGSRPIDLSGSLREILERCVGEIEELAVRIMVERPRPVPQEGPVTLFRRRRPEESDITEVATAGQLFDRIRMVDADGYPRAYLETPEFRVEFRDAEFVDGQVVAQARFTPKREL